MEDEMVQRRLIIGGFVLLIVLGAGLAWAAHRYIDAADRTRDDQVKLLCLRMQAQVSQILTRQLLIGSNVIFFKSSTAARESLLKGIRQQTKQVINEPC